MSDLFKYRGTSVPWTKASTEDMNINVPVKPANWLLSDNGDVRPYKFEYISCEDTGAVVDFGDPDIQVFAQPLRRLLCENGLLGLFGLCRYPGDYFRGSAEMTVDRANINLLLEDVSILCFSEFPWLSPRVCWQSLQKTCRHHLQHGSSPRFSGTTRVLANVCTAAVEVTQTSTSIVQRGS